MSAALRITYDDFLQRGNPYLDEADDTPEQQATAEHMCTPDVLLERLALLCGGDRVVHVPTTLGCFLSDGARDSDLLIAVFTADKETAQRALAELRERLEASFEGEIAERAAFIERAEAEAGERDRYEGREGSYS